jgi:hypothetical protein
MFWGNRGALLDEAGQLARYSRGRLWITCVLSFKGRRRTQWQPRRLTELYFLDEATALAAGHRPCGECRYRDYQEFKRRWTLAFGTVPSAGDMDARLHADRVIEGQRRDRFAGAAVRRMYTAPAPALPDGAMVSADADAWLVSGGSLLRWTPGGYQERRAFGPDPVTVITPRATVQVLAAGYRPLLHPTAFHPSALNPTATTSPS